MQTGEFLGAAVTVIVAFGTAVFTVNNVRRTDFERARQLHAELTTGAVAEAGLLRLADRIGIE